MDGRQRKLERILHEDLFLANSVLMKNLLFSHHGRRDFKIGIFSNESLRIHTLLGRLSSWKLLALIQVHFILSQLDLELLEFIVIVVVASISSLFLVVIVIIIALVVIATIVIVVIITAVIAMIVIVEVIIKRVEVLEVE